MAWALRGKKLYYYRTRREGRRVIREYHGSGPEARLAAALDASRRAARDAQRRDAQAEQARVAGADSLVLSFCELAELVARRPGDVRMSPAREGAMETQEARWTRPRRRRRSGGCWSGRRRVTSRCCRS